MSTNTEDTNEDMAQKAGETQGAHAHAPAPDGPDWAENGRDSVSISKSTLPDGAERTQVVHPPRMLKTPGEIKRAYESGRINLERFITNVNEGLEAMASVVTTYTEGAGKDRVTKQEVTMVPDHAMRLKWQEHITATVEGMPVKRQEIISRKITTDEELVAKAKKSPALRKAMMKQLQKMEADDLSIKRADN